MTYKEVFKRAVPQDKRDEDKFALVSTNISRPISIWLTIPLLNTNIQATTITKLSVVSMIIGFVVLYFSKSLEYSLLGWSFFFIWAVLDHVDGNIARYKNECSLLGDLWDTMGGYIAMILMYYSAGIMAFKESYCFDFLESYHYLMLGSATSILAIFPRLMMHKKKSSLSNNYVGREFTDKKNFNIPKIVMMNLVAPCDGLLLLFLISIILKLNYLFVLFYFVINVIVTTVALHGILKEN